MKSPLLRANNNKLLGSDLQESYMNSKLCATTASRARRFRNENYQSWYDTNTVVVEDPKRYRAVRNHVKRRLSNQHLNHIYSIILKENGKP
ncbi:hypothetical protein Tco_0744450 [Tanacetum coccineum]